MPSNVLTTGKTAAISSEITITEEASGTFFLKSNSRSGRVSVQIKDDLDGWVVLGELNAQNKGYFINSPGIYRFVRYAGNAAGVSRG